jgi:FimV-like protein
MLIFFIFIGFILLVSTVISFIYFKKKRLIKVAQKPVSIQKSNVVITSQDIKAIAGEDMLDTQLDLARAYIEIGKIRLAKKILDHVAQHGNSGQQRAAYQLMTTL